MCLDCEAITGLPCLEEALDCFREVGLLPLVTDKEHWNEELLLQFLLGNVVISKKFLSTRKIMVMHSNERGECVHVPS